MGGMETAVRDVVPELILLGGAVVVLLFALFAPRGRQVWAAALALATLAASAVATATLFAGGERLTFAGTSAVDGVALWGTLVVLGTTAAVVALSVEWFAGDPRHGEYYALLLLSALGAALMAGAADVMQLTLAVLLSSATLDEQLSHTSIGTSSRLRRSSARRATGSRRSSSSPAGYRSTSSAATRSA